MVKLRMFDAGLREDRPVVVHDKVLTVANAITLVRFLGLPLFVYLVVGSKAYGWAFAVLWVVGWSDWIDGYVARRFDQVTKIGQLIDPLIDRVMLATVGITLVAVGFAPWWVVVAVVARDLLLLGGGLIVFKGKNPQIPVTRMGKFATACLLASIPAFLPANMDWWMADFWLVWAWVLVTAGLPTYYIAGAMYVQTARQILESSSEPR